MSHNPKYKDGEAPRCCGVRLTWPSRGWPCGNDGIYEGPDGLPYCGAHIGIAQTDPQRFIDAMRPKGQRRRT